jgi:hypothetical protein
MNVGLLYHLRKTGRLINSRQSSSEFGQEIFPHGQNVCMKKIFLFLSSKTFKPLLSSGPNVGELLSVKPVPSTSIAYKFSNPFTFVGVRENFWLNASDIL